jgi:hypothetical protein
MRLFKRYEPLPRRAFVDRLRRVRLQAGRAHVGLAGGYADAVECSITVRLTNSRGEPPIPQTDMALCWLPGAEQSVMLFERNR